MNENGTDNTDGSNLPDLGIDTDAAQVCPVWCVEDHERYEAGWHSGQTVELTDSDGTGKRGWWAWPTKDPGQPIMFEFEGPDTAVTISAGDLAAILAATASQGARATLTTALASVGQEVTS